MSPKEKALELYKLYHDICNCTIAGTDTIFRDIAKKCAIYHCEEVINMGIETSIIPYNGHYVTPEWYYKQVIGEIKILNI